MNARIGDALRRDRGLDLDFGRVGDLTRALVFDLDIACERIGDLDHARELAAILARARDLAHARDLARRLDRALDRNLNLVLDIDFDSALDHARDLVGVLAEVLGDVETGNLVLNSVIASALNRAYDSVNQLGPVFVHATAAIDRARDRAQRGEARRVAPSAARLVLGAARLLPAADRARYAEEYHSELSDLARDGAGRLGQLGYALRQLRSAPRTGLALRSPRRRGAAP